ncbi:hypothetical protein ACI6PS_16045 [Flavobacterium sp. PLA-1-15]|uniref:hypothetical protein n=1 Tax=Flavobacterium sp. PLA-1-15 TaxID=3380533 RepID=UPI003B7E86D5
MKKTILLLLLAFTFACDKDDDKKSTNPIDQLPPATQTGAQTFGCLIDGKTFVPPKFGNNAPNAFYQFVNGAYTLGISASISGGPQMKSINIGGLDMPLIQETTYLLKEELTNNYFGEYNIGGGITFSGASTTENPGTLTITHFDPVNFIISGTFEFTVLDDNGTEIKITDGRFDMQYTN